MEVGVLPAGPCHVKRDLPATLHGRHITQYTTDEQPSCCIRTGKVTLHAALVPDFSSAASVTQGCNW